VRVDPVITFHIWKHNFQHEVVRKTIEFKFAAHDTIRLRLDGDTLKPCFENDEMNLNRLSDLAVGIAMES
jgi:hypothetical protein